MVRSQMAGSAGNAHSERGAVAVMVGISMAAFLGTAAIAVDVGNLYAPRSQLQTSSDASALAAVNFVESPGQATSGALDYADHNSEDLGLTVDINDVVLGSWDSEFSVFVPGRWPRNAVEVTARRNTDRGNAVQYQFAAAWDRSKATSRRRP